MNILISHSQEKEEQVLNSRPSRETTSNNRKYIRNWFLPQEEDLGHCAATVPHADDTTETPNAVASWARVRTSANLTTMTGMRPSLWRTALGQGAIKGNGWGASRSMQSLWKWGRKWNGNEILR